MRARKTASLRSLRAKERLPHSNTSQATAVYAKLMSVSFNHTYYGPLFSGDAELSSLDFELEPIAETTKRMQALNLLYKRTDDGFTVLYNKNRTDVLLSHLRFDGTANHRFSTEGTSTRLSFLATVKNADFFNFTALPLDFSTQESCYYADNTRAHSEPVSGSTILNEDKFLSDSSPIEVVTGDLDVEFYPEDEFIELVNAAGDVVYCFPRQFPEDLLEECGVNFITCEAAVRCARQNQSSQFLTRDRVSIAFQVLPAGYYQIVHSSGQGNRVLINRRGNSASFCLIDLFLTAPPSGQTHGIYPRKDLADPEKTRVEFTPYNLNFQARSTYWEYLIVPPEGSEVSDLSILNNAGGTVGISPPVPKKTGVSTKALSTRLLSPRAMERFSKIRWKLKGNLQKENGFQVHDTVLISHMPVASTQPVRLLKIPVPDFPEEPTSDSRTSPNNLVESTQIFLYL